MCNENLALIQDAPRQLSILPSGPLDLKPVELGITSLKPTKQEINHNRQYQWVCAVATSQELRIQKFGQLRKNPGYDVHDGFIDDNPEPVLEGTPMMRVGDGKLFTFVRPGETEDMIVVSDPETDIREDVLSNEVYPMPLEPPQQGEYAVIVGSEVDIHLNGRLVVVGMPVRNSEDKRWVQLVDVNAVDDTMAPLQIAMSNQFMVSIPRDKILTPWEQRFRARAAKRTQDGAAASGSNEPATAAGQNEEELRDEKDLLQGSMGRLLGEDPTESEPDSDGELHDEKGYQGPPSEDEADYDDFYEMDAYEEDTWPGCIVEVSDVQLPGQDKDKKKAAKANKDAGAIVDAASNGKMFAVLVDQKPGLGCMVRLIQPKCKEHITIDDDSKLQAIASRKLLDHFICKFCRKCDRDHELVLCEGPACMHAEHVGCGDLAIMPGKDEEWRCKDCTALLSLWDVGMQVMVKGKAKEQESDADDASKHGPRLGQVVKVAGGEGTDFFISKFCFFIILQHLKTT